MLKNRWSLYLQNDTKKEKNMFIYKLFANDANNETTKMTIIFSYEKWS